jgi:hypothetical protein
MFSIYYLLLQIYELIVIIFVKLMTFFIASIYKCYFRPLELHKSYINYKIQQRTMKMSLYNVFISNIQLSSIRL